VIANKADQAAHGDEYAEKCGDETHRKHADVIKFQNGAAGSHRNEPATPVCCDSAVQARAVCSLFNLHKE